MTSETGQKTKPTDTTPPLAGEAIEHLMAGGQVPGRKSEARAQAANAGGAAAPAAESAPLRSGGASRTRLMVLRALLAANVLAMVALLFVPTGTTRQSSKPSEGTGNPEPVHQDPTGHASTPRPRRPAYPDKELYTHALQLGSEGKYVEAVEAFEEYLRRNPALPNDQRRNVFLAMQYYNSGAGRTKEAEACLASAQQLIDRSFLPEDLLTAAELAEKSGNGAEMRRNYARFLLLQKSLPAALRERVAEAYLKLGDSYRVEADKGEERAQSEAEARQQRLKEGGKTGERRGAGQDAGTQQQVKEPK